MGNVVNLFSRLIGPLSINYHEPFRKYIVPYLARRSYISLLFFKDVKLTVHLWFQMQVKSRRNSFKNSVFFVVPRARSVLQLLIYYDHWSVYVAIMERGNNFHAYIKATCTLVSEVTKEGVEWWLLYMKALLFMRLNRWAFVISSVLCPFYSWRRPFTFQALILSSWPCLPDCSGYKVWFSVVRVGI